MQCNCICYKVEIKWYSSDFKKTENQGCSLQFLEQTQNNTRKYVNTLIKMKLLKNIQAFQKKAGKEEQKLRLRGQEGSK